MTTTTDQAAPAADQDPLELLTIRELDTGSRILRHDLLDASSEGHYLRSAAMAVTAYLLARRDDPKVKLATFRAMTLTQLAGALGLDLDAAAVPADADDQGVEVDDDDLAAQLLDADDGDTDDPADPADDAAQLEAAMAADPTESTAGSSSPDCGAASLQGSSGT